MKKIISEDITISDDRILLQPDVIHSYLTRSYWNEGIPIEFVKKAVDNSFCVGVYYRQKQIGFARVVTDFVLSAYLGDVFILEEFRGRGLSKQLMEFLFDHPELCKIKSWRLATKDAQTLYSKFGFVPVEKPERMMERKTKLW